jgi:hypothetical protein
VDLRSSGPTSLSVRSQHTLPSMNPFGCAATARDRCSAGPPRAASIKTKSCHLPYAMREYAKREIRGRLADEDCRILGSRAHGGVLDAGSNVGKVHQTNGFPNQTKPAR